MRATTAVRRHTFGFLHDLEARREASREASHEARREARPANVVATIPRVIMVPCPDEILSATVPPMMPVSRPRVNRAPLRRSERIYLLNNPPVDEQHILESARLVRRGFLRSGREFK